MAKKEKDEDGYQKPRFIRTELDDIVDIKKKKAVSNELDEFLYEQEQKKKTRESQDNPEIQVQQTTNPAVELLSSRPEALENMSEEGVMKLAMLMAGNSGGGMNPLLTMMMMNQNNQQPSNIVELVTALKGLKEMSDDGNHNNSQGNSNMNEAMMLMLMQKMMNQNNQPRNNKDSNNDKLTAQLIGLITNQSNMERQIVMDKLKELEYRSVQSDPMGEAKRMIDYMKSFKTLFGGNSSPEQLNHDLEMQKLQFEQSKELRKVDESESKMNQIGGLISDSIRTFSDVLSKPIAEGLKERIENPKEREIDFTGSIPIDDLDMKVPPSPPSIDNYKPPAQPKMIRKTRFQVKTSDAEDDY